MSMYSVIYRTGYEIHV